MQRFFSLAALGALAFALTTRWKSHAASKLSPSSNTAVETSSETTNEISDDAPPGMVWIPGDGEDEAESRFALRRQAATC
ncbi:MAG TPA: hypothetical protein VMV10_19300 [Pirellulales bacterium]|nr:hypothetical protein [Pirellulales bacterium]